MITDSFEVNLNTALLMAAYILAKTGDLYAFSEAVESFAMH